MTPDEQRAEEHAAMERERQTFERRQSAFTAVQHQLLPHGSGTPTIESMDEFDQANAEWHEAKADVDRIAGEIRSGKRR